MKVLLTQFGIFQVRYDDSQRAHMCKESLQTHHLFDIGGSTSTQRFSCKGATLTAREAALSDDEKHSLCRWQLDPYCLYINTDSLMS